MKPRARRSDPQTSHDAARSFDVEQLTHLRKLILFRLDRPKTDEQIVQQVMSSYPGMYAASSIRTRRKELQDLGYVTSGATISGARGRKMMLWERTLQANELGQRHGWW